MKAFPTVRAWPRRLAQSLLGAALAALGGAVFDAGWARGAAGDAGEAAKSAAGRAIYLADAGLVAPVALALGLAAWAFALLVDDAAAPSPRSVVDALRLRAKGRPADVAAFVPLAALGAFFWATLAAHLARALLAIDVAPALAGVAIATASLALALVVGLVVLALTPPLRHALANASAATRVCVDPVVTLAVALALTAGLFAVGVRTGTISGEGGFFGIWGIFKRPELDLRAPALALVIAAFAFFGPALLGWVRGSVAIVLALLPLALTGRAAGALDRDPAAASAIERGAPLGKPALALLRKLTDRDHDGFSGTLGGGDCDDRNPEINPLATDIPDDGIDQDCSGADLSSAAIAKLAPPSPPPLAAAEKPALPEDMNLLLITVDTLRADLHYAGNPHDCSPNLDKLAAESAVFERAYSLASYTGKSVGPLLIGKYASETHRNWGHSNIFSKEDTTLAERLKKAGFHTMSAQALRYFGTYSGLARGFDVVDMRAAGEGSIKEMEQSASADKLSDQALKMLGNPEHSGKRFFLWMHYVDPHADYLRHDGMPVFGKTQRDGYDGEIAFVDKHLGRVIDYVATQPWGKKTVIVVSSDHGEAFGEHDMWRHGSELWEELVRVPLIIHVPGAAPVKVAMRRSAIDLVPTLLELLGVPAPAATNPGNDFVSGVSMMGDLFPSPSRPPQARDVLIDMPGGPFNDPRRSLIHGDLKLTISNGSSYELYDLAKDPDEKKNLAKDDAAALASVMPYYEAAKARLREFRVTGERKTGGGE